MLFIKMSDDTTNPSNAEQNIPLLPTISNGSSELEFLRHIESLFVKQLPSAIEGKFLKYEFYYL